MEDITNALSSVRISFAPKTVVEADPREPKVALTANMFPLVMKKNIPVYQYRVNIVLQCGPRTVSLVKQTKDDFLAIDHKDKCRTAFRLAVCKHRDFFQQPSGMYYDVQSTLFSINKLLSDAEVTQKVQKDFLIDAVSARKTAAFVNDPPFEAISVQLTPVHERYELYLGDEAIQKALNVESSVDQELTRYLDVATSQHAYLEQKQFVTYPAGLSFFTVDEKKLKLEPERRLEGGNVLVDGVRKAVKIIDGEHELGAPGELAVVVDPKKTVFHAPGVTVAQKVKELGFLDSRNTVNPRRIDELSQMLKHLFVETRYGSFNRRFDIHSVVADTARKNRFTIAPGTSTTVLEYYQSKYKITLQMPDAPLVSVKQKGKRPPGSEKGNFLYFPMELLFVCPNQRVTNSQMTPQMISAMIRTCAMLPEDRLRETKMLAAALRINGSSVHSGLKSASLEIANELMSVEGRSLPPPQILYKNKQCAVDESNGKWKPSGRGDKAQFMVAASLIKWAVVLVPAREDSDEDQLAIQFYREMMKECRSRGMTVQDPVGLEVLNSSFPEAIDDIFQKAKRSNIKFLLFLQDQRLSVHNDIKFFERKYEIITQDLTTKTARAVVENGKFLTLENIVAKTNMKLGGLNHSIAIDHVENAELFKKGRLYLGFQINHAAPPASHSPNPNAEDMARMPTVIGVAGNVTAEPAAFIGDIFFQKPREDKLIDSMKDVVMDFIQRYTNAVGEVPSEIIIYRSGMSEGQYTNIFETEIPIIKCAMRAAGAENAKLTLIVVTKLHSVRIMPAKISGTRAPEQNVKPGTVVDSTIVHPRFAEFYLNGHSTLQGSAKTPRYTVIVDERIAPISELERITYALSYGHQIVGMPTSLPCPAYIAGCYAERATALHQVARTSGEVKGFDRLTEMLSYGRTSIGDKRINA